MVVAGPLKRRSISGTWHRLGNPVGGRVGVLVWVLVGFLHSVFGGFCVSCGLFLLYEYDGILG